MRLTGDIRRNISYTAKTTLLQNEASAITAGTQAVRMSFEVPDEQRAMLLNITPRLGFNRWVPQPDGTVTGSVGPEQVPNDEPLAGVRWGHFNYPVSDGRDPRADVVRDPPGRGDDGVWAAGGFRHHSAGGTGERLTAPESARPRLAVGPVLNRPGWEPRWLTLVYP